MGEKDKQTTALEPVDWFHAHSESTPKQPRFKKAFCYLLCTLRIGDLVATVDLRLYLREKTVRRLNRHRPAGQRIPFYSKNHLTRQMLTVLRPLLPAGWNIQVQFDSWYASEKLIKDVRRHGWHVTCGLKGNRRLNGKRLDQFAYALRHQRYRLVRVPAAERHTQTYYVREASGHLAKVLGTVRVYFSKQHPRVQSLGVLHEYGSHSLGASRLAGLRRALVVRGRQFVSENPVGPGRLSRAVLCGGGQIHGRRVGDMGICRAAIRSRTFCPAQDVWRHRDEHTVDWLTGALEMLQATGDMQLVLQRFLRLETQPV